MKNSSIIVAIFSVTALFSGCMSSLNPFYAPADVYSDRNIVGTWKAQGENETWKIEEGEGGRYRLTQTESDGSQGAFEAVLFRVGDASYLDLRPIGDLDRGSEFHRSLPADSHILAAIKIGRQSAEVATLDDSVLKERLANGSVSLAHKFMNGELVLTDSTAKIRAFLAANATGSGVFEEWTKMEKLGVKK